MKLNKKQQQALKDLLIDLDELTNKPRRLFFALEKFAIAFDKTDAIPSIREAQAVFYDYLDEGQHYAELFNSLREFRLEEWGKQIKYGTEEGVTSDKLLVVESYIKKHISRLANIKLY